MVRLGVAPILGKDILPPKGLTGKEIRQRMKRLTSDGERLMAQYPPAPAGSTYIRTRTLGRSWTNRVRDEGSKIVGTVGSNSNMAPYNRWVQGPDDLRARQHVRIGWIGIDELADQMEAILPEVMQEEINQTIKRR